MPTNSSVTNLDAHDEGRTPNNRDVVSQSSVQERQTLTYYIAQIKHLYKRQVTIPFGFAQDRHDLDTGIHAGMTAFLA
jgi:hypothetical protein